MYFNNNHAYSHGWSLWKPFKNEEVYSLLFIVDIEIKKKKNMKVNNKNNKK